MAACLNTPSWEDLEVEAQEALAARVRLEEEVLENGSTIAELNASLLREFNIGLDSAVATGSAGVWSRAIARDMLDNISDVSRERGQSVLGTLQLIRKTGNTESHLHSARLDWINSSFNEPRKRRRTASEMVSRYFMSALRNVNEEVLRTEAEAAITLIWETVRGWNANLNSTPIMFSGALITRREFLFALRFDMVVAVGLLMPAHVGGGGASTISALEDSSRVNNMGLPLYLHQGDKAKETEVGVIHIEIEWPVEGGGRSETRRCDLMAGYFVTNPIVYNSGLGAAVRDYVNAPGLATEWITLILTRGMLVSTTMERQSIGYDDEGKRKVSWITHKTLLDAIRAAQAATWVTTSKLGTLKITVGNIVWKACINNVIVNDIGDGATPTYGDVCAATIRVYAQITDTPRYSPLVPSIQAILDPTLHRPQLVHLTEQNDGGDISFPLLMDSKTLCVVPVLLTILGKANTLNPAINQTRRTSKLKLASAFGLQSPDDIINHIDFILGEMSLFHPFFDRLNHVAEIEVTALVNIIKITSDVGFASGTSIDGLRGSKHAATLWLQRPANRATSLAYAWSVVESAIIICWLVTYVAAGIGPVPYPLRYTAPPDEGVEAITYMLQLTLSNWLDWERVNTHPGSTYRVGVIKEPSIRALQQLISDKGRLNACLLRCRRMILDSPDL